MEIIEISIAVDMQSVRAMKRCGEESDRKWYCDDGGGDDGDKSETV